MKNGISLWMHALRQKRLGVGFRMWLPVAASAYVFGLALWRALDLPEVLPGVLKLVFCVVCLAAIACAAFIPRAKPDEMSEAAYGKAAKYANRLLLAAMWILILLLSPYMDSWFAALPLHAGISCSTSRARCSRPISFVCWPLSTTTGMEPKMTDDLLKNNISAYREKLGMTQLALAEACGVRRETIVNLERGRYNPSLKLALRICAVLGARVEDLFWMEG